MKEVMKKLSDIGVVPVIKLDDAKKAEPLAEALREGGLPCAEVTFRTDACVEAIHRMREAFPDMIVGAGTVLSVEQVKEAAAAGAQFVVSPGFDPEVVGYCVDNGILVVPGCSSPSDVGQAMQYGLEAVKFFPAEAAGGLKMIRAMAGPYSGMKFFPTGGINEGNIAEYLSCENVICCGGTWMVPEEAVRGKRFDEIRSLTEGAVRRMLDFRLAHVGINSVDEKEAERTAKMFETVFGFQAEENPSSIFNDKYVEVLKRKYLGAMGHIAVETNFVERAVEYLKRRGVEFLEESAVYRPDRKLQAIYLKEEFGGFAVHLVRKKQNRG